MSEPVDWLDDGTPFSPRFGDRYRSQLGGLAQARGAFLAGCGLPAAWADQPQWRILETGFGLGLNFLVAWQAWRQDPRRPRLLHFVSTEAYPVDAPGILRNCAEYPELQPLAEALAAQWWGLLPGVHRLAFDEGRVLLTLCIGDAQTLLRQQALTVDSVFLDGFSPRKNPELWNLYTLQAVARCCRPGTRLGTWCVAGSVRATLVQCGFAVQKVPGVPPKRHNLQATFAPRWTPRQARLPETLGLSTALPGQPDVLVIGAGLAGAAVASSLARRGHGILVLDQADAPAAGASGLPAGLFAPHVSPDDSVVSRLSRSGVRTTLQTASAWLQEGVDWQPSGVLQHHVDGKRGLPADADAGPRHDWSHPAPDQLRTAAGLPPEVRATWHQRGGWIRPAQLVRALLAQPGIRFQGRAAVAGLVRLDAVASTSGLWHALDPAGQVLASAPLVVVATGFGSLDLLGATHPALAHWPLNQVRGQVTGARQADWPWPGPAFPVNGHGNCVPDFPWPDGPPGQIGVAPVPATADDRCWLVGSTFERGPAASWPPDLPAQTAAHDHNLEKLRILLPDAKLPPPSPGTPLRHWAGVRCTSRDRLPVVGPVDASALPGLWVCTAMGARGLTLSLLCGELLAARLMGEPLPVDAALAKALDSARLGPLQRHHSEGL